MKSNFDRSPNKGYTFGSGRYDSPFKSFLNKAVKRDVSPGPETYQIPSTLEKKTTTMGKKFQNPNERKSPTPGPN